MPWIKVTDPQGHTVHLCVEQLVRIRPCIAEIDFPAPAADAKAPRDRKNGDLSTAQSMIDLATGKQAVRKPRTKSWSASGRRARRTTRPAAS